MKLIYCEECNQAFGLINNVVCKCSCGKYAGKYLNDGVTTIINKVDGANVIQKEKERTVLQKILRKKKEYETIAGDIRFTLPIIFGIDNNTFKEAMGKFIANQKFDIRVDAYFTGWIPNYPGEIIFVDSIEEVENYNVDGHLDRNDVSSSTRPTTTEEELG